MKLRIVNIGIVVAVAFATNNTSAQEALSKRNFEAEVQAAIQSAKTAAGFEHLGTLVRTFLLPQSGGENLSDNVPAYVTNLASAPARDTWYAAPAKVFDNLYFVGGKLHSSWALTTKEGIILIDTIYPYNSEELVIGGMKKLGLDPKNIKYVLISHAHADHIGGAEMLQTRYKARVVMGGPDWDWVEKYPNRYKTMAPKRDIVATDGMKITLGGTTVTIWLTPGHTPGTMSYTLPCWITASRSTWRIRAAQLSISSTTHPTRVSRISRLTSIRRNTWPKKPRLAAQPLLSNHSEFDNAVNKNRMLAGRGKGPHPYEIGTELVRSYLSYKGCARAAQLRLERKWRKECRKQHFLNL
jgi:metallo-beta-lactamase class B